MDVESGLEYEFHIPCSFDLLRVLVLLHTYNNAIDRTNMMPDAGDIVANLR